MGFLNQIMLLGTLGVAVPILIHLLNRYRYREVDWAAMELLRRAMVVRSRRVRIEDLLLLILRCLAVALLAISMARPTLNASGARLLGGESRVGMVIALDGSYSMAHRPGVHSRFDVAMQKVREIVKTLQPGDQVSVVLMGQRPRTLLRNVSFDLDRIDRKLRTVGVLPERLNLDLGLEQVARLVADLRAPVRECYIISDSQDLSWRQVSDRSKQLLEEVARSGRVYYLSVATGAAENLSLADFQMSSGAMRTGSMVRYVASVRNTGRRPARNVPVTLQVRGKTADRRVVDTVEPGSAVPVDLYAKFDTAGNVTVTVSIDHDALDLDNVRHAAARVHDRIRVLVVDGDPGRGLAEGEAFYLLKALVPDATKPAQATIRLKHVASVELGLQEPRDYDIVVLANVPDLRDAQARALLSFVRQGGGLMVFLGDQAGARLLNARMAIGEDCLLPARLTEPIEVPAGSDSAFTLDVVDPSHPLGRFLGRLPKPLIAEAQIRKLFGTELLAGARVILRAAGANAPLLIEKPLGRGHVLLYTSSADRDWGSVAIHPAYLIFLHEAVTYLTRRAHERQFTVGEPLAVAVPSQAAGEQFVLHAPDGEVTSIQAVETAGGRIARCGLPEVPGFYRLAYEQGADPLMMAVNVAPTESDVQALTAEDLADAVADMPIRVLAGDDLFAEVTQGRTGLEMWRVLMVLALAVLCLEALLARRFSGRLAGESDAVPTGTGRDLLGKKEAA